MQPSSQLISALALYTVLSSAHAQTIDLQPFMQTGSTVHAVVNGQAGNFMFDTGGGISIITPEFARKIGCRPWGQITGFRMSGERLDSTRCDEIAVRIGPVSAHVDSVGVVDLKKLLPPGTDLDGSLALDLFDDKVVAFSQARRTLTVTQTVPAALAACPSVPLRLVRVAEGLSLTVDLPVRTRAGMLWFEMDSGNLSPYTVVNQAIATHVGLQADAKTPQTVALTLADGTTFSSPATVMNMILDGNLGTRFLARHDVTLDLPHKRAWIVPAGRACGDKPQ